MKISWRKCFILILGGCISPNDYFYLIWAVSAHLTDLKHIFTEKCEHPSVSYHLVYLSRQRIKFAKNKPKIANKFYIKSCQVYIYHLICCQNINKIILKLFNEKVRNLAILDAVKQSWNNYDNSYQILYNCINAMTYVLNDPNVVYAPLKPPKPRLSLNPPQNGCVVSKLLITTAR